MSSTSGPGEKRSYVALDLETTGLNPDQDTIIEIGAVKFQGSEVIDTYQTLVNPYRDLPDVIQRLTGIAQRNVDRAPPFAAVAGELQDFVGNLPVVGHNISFDLNFLSMHGLPINNETYDTWDLASILLPYSTDYSLGGLVGQLGAQHPRPHRALPDAQATHQVFVNLLALAGAIDPAIAAYIQALSSRAQWPVGLLFGGLPSLDRPQTSRLGPNGLDMESLGNRLGRSERAIRSLESMAEVGEDQMASYLAPGGLFARAFPGFEHRPQQVDMMRAVAGAISRGERLMVEGGTGVGKSLAYLLPAVIHSLAHGTRVVVSTNTINLQEQLLQKDIPALVKALEDEGVIPRGEFRAVPLKGRANYLCFRRWGHLARGEDLSGNEVRLLGKTMLWLQDTGTGDRGEINLSGRDAATWGRVSADEKAQCPGMRGEGYCFLRTARDRTEGAHIIVVNHSLLMSDMAMGGGILPEYHHLIVDEAHHLEEEATRQLGVQVSQNRLNDVLDTLARLLGEVRVFARPRPSLVEAGGEASQSISGLQAQRAEELTSEMDSRWPKRMKDSWDRLWSMIERVLNNPREKGGDQSQLRITAGVRAQPGWSDVEIAWENVDVGLADGTRQIEALHRFLDTLPSSGLADMETLMSEMSIWRDDIDGLREMLRDILVAPADERRIDWVDRFEHNRNDQSRASNVVLHSAPLNVAEALEEGLFSKKSSVILTSATLSTQGNFDYIRERVGLGESRDLLVGSPFNYNRAALLLMPEDIAMPDAWGYQQAMEKVLVELGQALEGHTLVLFTSHAALRGTARAVRGSLEAEGIRVLAQGIDGSPRQILRSFDGNPKGVILGTSSFWEGVDLSEGALHALVLARLPFHVPSDPIFSARSAQYTDSFNQYALPQAVLRFRQGIGRLIRRSQDKGTIVVLDKRIAARPYGKAFRDSIPQCTVKLGTLSNVAAYAAEWIGKGKRA